MRRFFRLRPSTRAEVYADADDELDAMITARIEYLQAQGLSPEEARAEALRRVGRDLEAARRRVHHSAGRRERRLRLHERLESIGQDLRYAVRGLLRRPGFTVVAALTLAIGIGATTAIFSAVNTLLLRPLPYERPEELMKVSLTIPANASQDGRFDMVWSYPKYRVFREAQQLFSSLAPYALQQATITRDEVEQLRVELVGASYLRTLGLEPQRGRDFDLALDAQAGATREVIISDALWQRRYNADPGIVGRTIELDREAYTIVGVGPADFPGLTGRAELFVPVTTRSAEMLGEIDSHEFHVVARRRSGIDAAAAIAGVEVLGAQVHDAFPGSRMGGAGRTGGRAWGAIARPLDDARVAPGIRRAVLVLFGAVAFVLLIACANVANLLLARADLRRRELAVRRAIGAGRARLVRLLLTESILLAALGGGAGLLLARSTVRALSTIDPAITLRAGGSGGMGAVSFASIQLDWTTLGFAFAVTLLVGLLFGLLPALDLTRTTLNATMKDAHARVTGGRRCLVIAEVALTMVLLAGSGLMIRTLGKLLSIDPGFDGRNVLTVRLTVPPGGLIRDSLPVFYVELLDHLRAIPGVLDAAIGNCPPLNGGCNGTRVTLLDRPKNDAAEVLSTGVHWVTPGWFGTLGVQLKRGRDFTGADRMEAPNVVVINETAARLFWAGEDPIGRRVGVGQGGFGDGAEVIGIVGDVRQNMDSLPKADVYLPYFQSPRPGMMIFVRTADIPGRSATAVRAALREVAPQYPIYDLKSMRERAAAATAQARFGAVLLGLFAAIALALAVIGVYGVVSLMVSARTREIGVRVALGADQRRVQRLVIGAGLVLALVGTALGLAGALLATRTLRSLLFELSPTDPATYAATAALLVGAATLASWVPARRAARLDPMRALRAD
jgi:putative ABC transport system permease protein